MLLDRGLGELEEPFKVFCAAADRAGVYVAVVFVRAKASLAESCTASNLQTCDQVATLLTFEAHRVRREHEAGPCPKCARNVKAQA